MSHEKQQSGIKNQHPWSILYSTKTAVEEPRMLQSMERSTIHYLKHKGWSVNPKH